MSKALYNGVELPALPEIANSYEYAWLLLATPNGTPQLLLANGSGKFSYSSENGDGIFLWFTTGMLCLPVGETWIESDEVTSDGNDLLTISASPAETFWANFDIYNEDGSLYLAASEPVPIEEEKGFDLKSWLTGFALGLSGKPLPLSTGKTLVGYSYNGTVLPKLPEWDREAYPYAVMDNNGSDTVFSIHLCSTLPQAYKSLTHTFLKTTGAYLYATYSTKGVYGDDWWSDYNGSGAYTEANTDDGSSGLLCNIKYAMFANFDVYDADGNLYLSASAPIPVYE